MRKFCGKPQFPHSFGRIGEITVLYAVTNITQCSGVQILGKKVSTYKQNIALGFNTTEPFYLHFELTKNIVSKSFLFTLTV